MASLSKAEIAALSTQERLNLIGELWESLEHARPDAAIDDAHRRILQKRLEGYDPERDKLLPLNEVCDRLRLQ